MIQKLVHKSSTSTNLQIDAKVGEHRQFERVGYFVVDPDSTPEKPVWNRAITLKEAKWEGKDD